MLRYASIALVLALVCFIFGFLTTMVAGGAVWILKMAFFVFAAAFVVLFGLDFYGRKKNK